MFRIFLCFIALIILSSNNIAMAENQQKTTEAVTAAKSWLNLVDNAKYAESWNQAATFFKKVVPKAQWQQMISGVRQPLGTVISRTLKSANYTTSVPGAPDGQYVIIQFNTSFTNKKSAVETITPMMDTDKKWHVSGYYIK